MSDIQHEATAPGTSRFVAELAGRPLLVVGVTFVVSAVMTGVLMLAVHGMDVAAAVTTLATIWALVLALVIYLLTARDTDRLLDSIDDLQEQLSAALETPGAGAEVIDAVPAAFPTTPSEPASVHEPSTTSPDSAHLDARLPADYLAALRRATGSGVDRIRRAWTPNPNGNGPWVVEDVDGDRWSIFQAGRGHPSVIPLGNPEQRRKALASLRQRLRQERADARRAKQNRDGTA